MKNELTCISSKSHLRFCRISCSFSILTSFTIIFGFELNSQLLYSTSILAKALILEPKPQPAPFNAYPNENTAPVIYQTQHFHNTANISIQSISHNTVDSIHFKGSLALSPTQKANDCWF
jgi:hypothetical protein